MSDAEIYVNRELKGRGKWSGDMAQGNYQIEVKKAGHKSTIKNVVVKSSSPQTITLDAPTPIYGTLNVNASQINTIVTMDGVQLGNAPYIFKNLLVGEHTFTFTKEGYESVTAKITIKEGEVVNYASNLVAQKVAKQNLPKKVFTNDIYKSMGSPNVCVIPDGYTEIKNDAFKYCHKLTTLTIPNSVTDIEDGAFRNCGLEKIAIGNTNFMVENGVLFNKSKTRLISSIGQLIKGSYTIPNTVTTIGNRAFACCWKLTSVTIPNSVRHIGDNAFMSCWKLTSVTIPNSVRHIGDDAFSCCKKLAQITIPNSVRHIGDNAFMGCDKLTSVTIPNSVTHIGYGAFMGCDKLTSVYIPNSVTSIKYNSFERCNKYLRVYISNSSPIYKEVKEMLGVKVITK